MRRYMTVEEAATKWCPMVRCYGLETEPANSRIVRTRGTPCFVPDRNPEFSRCIADSCAMWVVGDDFSTATGRCGLVR